MTRTIRPRTVDPVMAARRAAEFTTRSIKTTSKDAALRLAVSMTDLTTLEGADTPERVRALCDRARRPVPGEHSPPVPTVAAVCVYPTLVATARERIAGTGIKVASVATAFPSGQAPLDVRLADVAAAVEAGADEIDMVINVRDSHAAQDSITDGYKIRRKAVDFSVTLLTDIKLATLLIGALARRRAPVIKSWDQYGL